jgi:hypothetical protein
MLLKKTKAKRGANKEAYLNEKFDIPFLSVEKTLEKTLEPKPSTSCEASAAMGQKVSTLTAKLGKT